MKTENFVIQELVYPEIYKERGDSCWELLDVSMLRSLVLLRKKFGIILINNWHIGGSFKESGLREMETSTGAKFSQHKFGRAADCKFKIPAEEVRQYVLSHAEEFPEIRCIEMGVSWFHFDVRNHNQPLQIMRVNP